MTEDHLHPVPDEAPAVRGAEAGWEPRDWAGVLRRHRRRQLAGPAVMVLLIFVVTPLLRWTVLDPTFGWTYWLMVVVTLIMVGETVESRVSTQARASWEREARQQVRVEHAWRHHVSIGAEDRACVTERAGAVATVSMVAFVGWPLLAGVLGAALLQGHLDLPAAFVVPVVAACLLLVGRSVRRRRTARRWLADPLPRDPAGP